MLYVLQADKGIGKHHLKLPPVVMASKPDFDSGSKGSNPLEATFLKNGYKYKIVLWCNGNTGPGFIGSNPGGATMIIEV